MPRATLVLHEKVVDEGGNLLELAIWKVPLNIRNPEGVRYRLAFIKSGEKVPAVLYDNHHPKGHHRHVAGNPTCSAMSTRSSLTSETM